MLLALSLLLTFAQVVVDNTNNTSLTPLTQLAHVMTKPHILTNNEKERIGVFGPYFSWKK